MSSAITKVTTITGPLATFLEIFYSRVGKRTKNAVSKVNLVEDDWTEKHTSAFNATKETWENSVIGSHLNQSSVFTDASDGHGPVVFDSYSSDDIYFSSEWQRYNPLIFFSGSFTGCRKRWSTREKKSVATIFSV